MKVATSIANIRPQNEVYLVGYIGKERSKPAIGIHDDPLVISILVEIQQRLLLFISIDIIMIPKEKANQIKNKICKMMNIEENNIIISAIHSHSSANALIEEGLLCYFENEVYDQFVIERILESLEGLDNKLVEAKAFIGNTKIHGFYSNRTNRDVLFDDNGYLIKFINKENQIVAAFCNFNCHSTVLGINNLYVSSDLIGEVRNHLGESLGVLPYTFTGASADISNRQYRQGNDFNELKRVGEGIASIFNKIDNYKELKLDYFNISEYQHHIYYDNSLYFEKYRESLVNVLKELENDDISVDDWKLRTTEQLILQKKLATYDIDFKVSGKVIEFNNLILITFPGELSSKFSLLLKEKSKKEIIIMGYADDYQGYFMAKEDYGYCYETIATNTPKGETEKIIEKIGELL